METKTCQNCKNDFSVKPEDLSFYQKMNVPAPTWCFPCRLMRKMCWRNERIWYRRTCDATGKSILSIFDPKKPYKVYDQEYWKSDAWDPMDYGREYDFSKNFFEQFSDLLKDVPHPNLIQKNVINSEYSNISLNIKNCYMTIGTDGAEDSSYINGMIRRVKESMDLYQCSDDEYCYQSVDCEKSNKLFFSQNCASCNDSFFLYDCRNCISCIGCVGLRNKQYYIFNNQYTREQYLQVVKELNTGSINSLNEVKAQFEVLKLSVPQKYAMVLNSENVIGDDIINARNCFSCFNAKDRVENCHYSFRVNQNTKDGYDGYIVWNGSEMFYDLLSSTGQNLKLSGFIWGGFDVEYSYNCFDCNNIFGCTGLRNKSYCILNKQYTKEEYQASVSKIKEHMNTLPYLGTLGKTYGYGEFFPPEISLFDYNETAAQDYYPKSKEQVLASGFSWRDSDEKNYQITKKVGELPDSISEVPDSITSEVIECLHQGKCHDQCATAFRIIPSELAFLKRFNIPLPQLCPACRHMDRIRLKNPMNLWHRTCMCDPSINSGQASANHFHGGSPCDVEFETSYAPDRPEQVYCEKCYQAEVL